MPIWLPLHSCLCASKCMLGHHLATSGSASSTLLLAQPVRVHNQLCTLSPTQEVEKKKINSLIAKSTSIAHRCNFNPSRWSKPAYICSLFGLPELSQRAPICVVGLQQMVNMLGKTQPRHSAHTSYTSRMSVNVSSRTAFAESSECRSPIICSASCSALEHLPTLLLAVCVLQSSSRVASLQQSHATESDLVGPCWHLLTIAVRLSLCSAKTGQVHEQACMYLAHARMHSWAQSSSQQVATGTPGPLLRTATMGLRGALSSPRLL